MKRRNFSRRKLLLFGLCLLLVGVAAAGSSLAYLYAMTQNYQNAFSLGGDIRARLTEPNWDPAEGIRLVPGKTIRKDPIITNTSKDQGEYVALRVIFLNSAGARFNSADLRRLLNLMKIQNLSGKWTLCQGVYTVAAGSVTTVTQPLVFYYNEALATGKVTDPLFTGLRVQNKYDSADVMTEADLNWLKSLGTISVKIEGAAVDSASFANAAGAAGTLIGLFP